MKEPLFIIWSPQGMTPPRYTHKGYEEAKRAAISMAQQHPGQEFYMMRAVMMAKVPDPIIIEHFDDGIPF